MPNYRPDQPATAEALASGFAGVLVAHGNNTTAGSGNTAATVAHGALDRNGNPFPAANLKCLAVSRAATGVYVNQAGTTASVIDVRSSGTSIAYDWYLFVVN